MILNPRKPMLIACTVLCASLFATNALAQNPTGSKAASKAGASTDQEEMFDEKLREFGYWSGAAHSCVAAEKQGEVERKVLDTFTQIGRLFGTDRAFFFAASFGYGKTIKVEPQKCPEFLSKFEKATAPRAGKGR